MKFKFIFSVFMLFYFFLSAQTIPAHLHQNWIEVASQGPNQTDTIRSIDTVRFKINIRFTDDGAFFMTDSRNKMNGIWKWNEDSTKLGMIQLQINDVVHENKPITEYPMLIQKLTKDSLIIGLNGPHGISREFYLSKQ